MDKIAPIQLYDRYLNCRGLSVPPLCYMLLSVVKISDFEVKLAL